jgi:hypothetical protein
MQHSWSSMAVPYANPILTPPEKAYRPPQRPSIEKRNPKQRTRSPQAPTVRPSSKRQRVAPRIRSDEEDPFERCPSQSGSQSTCCSSCPDSPPCAEPDCNLLVPCTEKTCGVPVCTDPCLDIATQNQLSISDQTRRLTNWDNSVWTPQSPRALSQKGDVSNGNIIDPTLRGFDRPEHPAGESPYSDPPSMVNNDLPTPYSPHTSQSTPQSNGYELTYDKDVLSGAGAMFHPSTDAFNGQSFGLSDSRDSSFTFNCRWDGCGQASFPTQDDWIPHFHQQHLDPQLTFRCPIPGQDCPPDIGFNIFDHLENDHGYNFIDESTFSCPAPTCDSTEKFCDPSLLHNHFDHAHAVPTEGTLQCRLDACNAGFTDPVQLISHINEFHDLPIPLPSLDDIDLTVPPEGSKTQTSVLTNDSYASILPENGASDQGPADTCKWVNGHSVCGKLCNSEVDLQNHITIDHLNLLDKTSGYNCQWHGCGRRDKRGEKSGFSQRGKLERHMATHTGCKQLHISFPLPRLTIRRQMCYVRYLRQNLFSRAIHETTSIASYWSQAVEVPLLRQVVPSTKCMQ